MYSCQRKRIHDSPRNEQGGGLVAPPHHLITETHCLFYFAESRTHQTKFVLILKSLPTMP